MSRDSHAVAAAQLTTLKYTSPIVETRNSNEEGFLLRVFLTECTMGYSFSTRELDQASWKSNPADPEVIITHISIRIRIRV